MEAWEKFEIECVEYLNEKFGNEAICFRINGGHNANVSDIEVSKAGSRVMSLECKMDTAQCGQFVLFTDYENRKFIFSPRNKTPQDRYVDAIISEMENNFDSCKEPSNEDLRISEKVIIEWVKHYYLNVKETEFCITNSGSDYIIFPINSIDKYFSFSAKYRPKRSGSSRPSKTNLAEIADKLHKVGIKSPIIYSKDDCYIELCDEREKFIIQAQKYRYQFKKDGNRYYINRLSNTKNANFIVSIRLKNRMQQDDDLQAFLERLSE